MHMGEETTIRLDLSMDSTDKKLPSSWSDLPLDMLEVICRKLSCCDQIYLCAVCKSWRIPKDRLYRLNSLPWIVFLPYNGKEARLLDPCANQRYKVANSMELKNYNCSYTNTTMHASKYGWLLLEELQCTRQSTGLLFLFNPFSGNIIPLPKLTLKNRVMAVATFTTNPNSADCEVLVVTILKCDQLYIHSCHIHDSRVTKWNMKYLGTTESTSYRVHYMKGKLYCLFKNGVLKSYSLTDESWSSLTSGYPNQFGFLCDNFSVLGFDPRFMGDGIRWWLTENDETLLAVGWDLWKGRSGYCRLSRWKLYRFDWLSNKWVVQENVLNNSSIFISGGVATTVPFGDNIQSYRCLGSNGILIDPPPY